MSEIDWKENGVMKMKKNLLLMLSVVLMLGCFRVTAFAEDSVAICVEADKCEVQAGDTVEYSVYLCGADTMEGGVWSYEFVLNIPDGMTFVAGSGNVTGASFKGFNMPFFNEKTMKCTSGMGALGQGHTGGKIALLTFKCTVSDNAAGKLTIGLDETMVGNIDGNEIDHTVADSTISLHQHAGSEMEFVWNTDNTCTVSYTCTVDGCGETISKAAVVEAESTDATCAELGKVTYTATIEVDGQTYTDSKTAESSTLPHNYKAEFVWAEDYSSATVNLVCQNCEKTVNIEAKDVAVIVKTSPATETSEGGVIYVASVTVEGQSFTDVRTEALSEQQKTEMPGDPETPDEKDDGKYIIITAILLCSAIALLVILRKKSAEKA